MVPPHLRQVPLVDATVAAAAAAIDRVYFGVSYGGPARLCPDLHTGALFIIYLLIVPDYKCI